MSFLNILIKKHLNCIAKNHHCHAQLVSDLNVEHVLGMGHNYPVGINCYPNSINMYWLQKTKLKQGVTDGKLTMH